MIESNNSPLVTWRYYLYPHQSLRNSLPNTQFGCIHNYSKELINSIERNYKEPIVGIGHSFGAAVTFLAAASRPDLFERVILLDPTIFSAKKRMAILLLKKT